MPYLSTLHNKLISGKNRVCITKVTRLCGYNISTSRGITGMYDEQGS